MCDNGVPTPEGVLAMSESAVGRTSDFIAESATQASRPTRAITEAIQDGIGVVRRAAQQGGDAAEEILTNTTQRIKRNPVLTVVTTFAAGFVAGTLIGWAVKRS
jgi:ElaB/YqjD/DUF883 family membrane-anchored ribosome-binding protein